MPRHRSARLSRSVPALLTTTALTTAGVVGVAVSSTPDAAADPCSTYVPGSVDRGAALLSSGTGSLPGSVDSSSGLGSSDITASLGPSWAGFTPSDLPNVTGTTESLYQLTGPNSPENTAALGLASTDLGFMWDAGDGRTLIAFGDSFTCSGAGNGWHSNALFESRDTDPTDGLYVDGTVDGSRSGEFLPTSLRVPGVEHTKIPTSGIEVGGRQYVDFMSVKSWGQAGMWTTNYAQTVVSTDGGRSFSPVAASTRTNSTASTDLRLNGGTPLPAHRAGDENFQMTALTKGTGQDAGYVYAYGTPNGRNGSARLARIAEVDFPDWSKATYWDGTDWSSEVSEATTVLDGRVSELSVQYNTQRGKWLTMYESTEGIVLREAASPTGPWGPKKTVVSRAQVPDIYGAFMLPNQSPTPDGKLYFVATSWTGYNTTMMRTDLNAVLG